MNYIRTSLCSLLFISTATIAEEAKLRGMNNVSKIKDQYIVVLKNDPQKSKALVNSLSKRFDAKVIHEYKYAIKGFSAKMTEKNARNLSNNPNVLYVEVDSMVAVNAVSSWGIDRIDQRNLPLNSSFSASNSGAGVNVYVIDTGVNAAHNDFSGRVMQGYSAISGYAANQDCHGHGTHVAGTIAGESYGIADDAIIQPVKVLNCSGNGSTSDIVEGIDWVIGHHSGPSVINMSIGVSNGGTNTTMDAALNRAINAGITTVVSGGNNTKDACNTSPGRVTNAIVVGATTASDAKANYSNFGACIDLFAPGSNIVSASNSNNSGSKSMSGTSMAAPHVAGVAALYLQSYTSASPATVQTNLLSYTSQNKLTNIGASSPNRLLYSAFNAEVSLPNPPTIHVEYIGCSGYQPRYIVDWYGDGTTFDVDYKSAYTSIWNSFYDGTSSGKILYGNNNQSGTIRARVKNQNGWSSFRNAYVRKINCSGGGPIIQ